MIPNLFQASIPNHFLLFLKSPVDGEKCVLEKNPNIMSHQSDWV